VIESIEEREILGKKQSYYVVKIPIGEMKVLIPIKNVDGIGIREVISEEDADKVFLILKIRLFFKYKLEQAIQGKHE